MLLSVFYTKSAYELTRCLSAEERKRETSFRFEKDRQRFAFAHLFKRHMLSAIYSHTSPFEWVFSILLHGKPQVREPISFNLSHSHDAVAIAILKMENNLRLGVDIECYRKLNDISSLIKMICHPQELAWLETLTDKVTAFYRLWTAKEALLKANGSGLINDLKTLNCVECLHENRCLVTWQGEQYWIDLHCLKWGICSVAWCDTITVSSLSFIDKSRPSNKIFTAD